MSVIHCSIVHPWTYAYHTYIPDLTMEVLLLCRSMSFKVNQPTLDATATLPLANVMDPSTVEATEQATHSTYSALAFVYHLTTLIRSCIA